MVKRRATTVSFGILLGLVTAVVLVEILLIWLVPYTAARYKAQLQRAEVIQDDLDLVLREHESLRMFPPVVGVMYRRMVAMNMPPESQKLYAELRGRNNEDRLRLLRQGKPAEESFLGILDYCFEGDARDRQLEELLVRAVAHGRLPYHDNSVYVRLSHNYYRTAERSQYAGLIDDARRLYRRFYELVRILNRDTALGVKVHRALNRANVRARTLAPEHAFATEAMRKIQVGPAATARSFVTYPDARLAGLARFNAASFLWHANGDREAAVGLLEGNLPACGLVEVECKFLLAKILNSLADANRLTDERVPTAREERALALKASTLLDELTRELPDGHDLLDDIYFHRALVTLHRRDPAQARVELQELRRRAPYTDLLADIKYLEESLSESAPVREPR